MSGRRTGVVVAVLLLAMAPGAAAQSVSTLPHDLEELVATQSLAIEGMLLGSAVPTGEYAHSLSFLPWLGGHGDAGTADEAGEQADAAGLGGAWRSSGPYGRPLFVAVGLAEIGVESWSAAVGSGLGAWQRGRAGLQVEAALGYQFERHDRGDRASVETRPSSPGGDEQVLVESLQMVHALLRARAGARLWVFEPRLELGLSMSAYDFDGTGWDESFPLEGGEAQGEAGVVFAPSFGLGLGLGHGGFRGFAGASITTGAGAFQLGISAVW